MDKFLIKIDRLSVKKNPNAGNTNYILQLEPSEITTTIEYIGKKVEQYVSIGTKEKKLIFCNIDWTPIHTEINKKCDTQILHSLTPEGNWLFDYEKTLIKCDYCKQEFLHTELEEDWDETADDCYPIHNICPKCGSSECCDIEYENIVDVLKELEKKE